MKREIIAKLHEQFENYSHELNGVECWFARELQVLLGYTQWRNFGQVITKAKTAYTNAGHRVEDHFADISKMVDIGSGTQPRISLAA